MKKFAGQVAVITGAASGIGVSISQKLIEEGAMVALLDVNEQALKMKFNQASPQVKLFSIDITNERLVDQVMHDVVATFGKIDMLVNCAGITGITNRVSHEVEYADLQEANRHCRYTLLLPCVHKV